MTTSSPTIIRTTTFKTVVGDVAFGAGGEWQHERMLQVQYQHLKGNDLSELKDMSKVAILDAAVRASRAR